MIIDLKNQNVPRGFQLGVSRRKDLVNAAGPMRISAYKIREYQRDLEGLDEELAEIGRNVRAGSIPYACARCSGFEMEEWTCKVPTYISHNLAYNFIEVLHGLAGDGVPKAIVSELIKKTKNDVTPILKLGEIGRLELANSWETAAGDLGGRSITDEFLTECISLVSGVLEIVKPYEGGNDAPLHK